jgi:hypothetical protein
MKSLSALRVPKPSKGRLARSVRELLAVRSVRRVRQMALVQLRALRVRLRQKVVLVLAPKVCVLMAQEVLVQADRAVLVDLVRMDLVVNSEVVIVQSAIALNTLRSQVDSTRLADRRSTTRSQHSCKPIRSRISRRSNFVYCVQAQIPRTRHVTSSLALSSASRSGLI